MERANVVNIYSDDLAVSVKNVYKSYRNSGSILSNLSMHVKTGTVYGLLGSSGCGKTTLLSCVVGLRSWDSGEILVFGEKLDGPPGRKLGYMPQDLALYNEISIRETIEYYGRLYGMTQTDIRRQWRWLVDFLKLPRKFKLLKECSGGQRRRVSLGVTLLHNPELLILDEPTVGLDPLLRESIWNYLRHMTTFRKTTVIVTTHYIEEARCAETIGVLRDGTLLVEESPTYLLQQYGCDLLEQVVLKLCHDISEKKNVPRCSPDVANNTREMPVQCKSSIPDMNSLRVKQNRKMLGNQINFKHSSSTAYQRIKAFSTVIWLVLMRQPVFLAAILFIPTFQVVITLAVIGTVPKDFRFGVVNYDTPKYDTCFEPGNIYSTWEKAGNGSDKLKCSFELVSCRVIQQLSETMRVIPIKSTELAREEVVRGNLWGYFYFPGNYSKNLNNFVVSGRFSNNETLEGTRLRLTMDMSHYLAFKLVLKDTYEGYLTFVTKLATSCGADPKEFQIPLRFREPVYGNNKFSDFRQYAIPICIVVVMIEIPLLITCLLYMNDQKLGTMDRSRVAGIQLKEIMISHLITQLSVIIIQIIICTMIVQTLWDFHVHGSYWQYFLLCILCGIGGEVGGFLFGNVFANEVEALFVTLLVGAYFILFAGLLWPWQGMKTWVRYLAYCMPCSLISESLRSVITRGVNLTHGTVWPGILVFLAWILGLGTISVIVFLRHQK